MENIYDKIQESANFIESKSEVKPSIGLILGFITMMILDVALG